MNDTNVRWYILSGINLNYFLPSHMSNVLRFPKLNNTDPLRQNLGIEDGFWFFSLKIFVDR